MGLAFSLEIVFQLSHVSVGCTFVLLSTVPSNGSAIMLSENRFLAFVWQERIQDAPSKPTSSRFKEDSHSQDDKSDCPKEKWLWEFITLKMKG